MCGIAGVYVFDRGANMELPTGRLLNQLLLAIESRGQHATGFAAADMSGKRFVLDKLNVPAHEYINKRKKFPTDARVVLAHTRWATQGRPEKLENNHPVMYGSTCVIHNGHISNDVEIFKELDLVRGAEVDSEAIAAVLHSDGFDNAGKALERLSGGFAVAATDVQSPDKLLLAKGPGMPLVYVIHGGRWVGDEYIDPRFLLWASTSMALKDTWGAVLGTPPSYKRFEYMVEGEMLNVTPEGIQKESFRPKGAFRSTYSYEGWEHGLTDEEWEDQRWAGAWTPSTGHSSGGTRGIGSTRAGNDTGSHQETRRPYHALIPSKPNKGEVESLKECLSWAVYEDRTAHKAVMKTADMLDLDPRLVRWMVFECDWDVIKELDGLWTCWRWIDYHYNQCLQEIQEEDSYITELEAEEDQHEEVVVGEVVAAALAKASCAHCGLLTHVDPCYHCDKPQHAFCADTECACKGLVSADGRGVVVVAGE